MTRTWQAVLISGLVTMVVHAADEPAKASTWIPLKIQTSAFSRELGMVDTEREEYATNLANCAATGVVQAKGSQASLDIARRLLSLALNLSPRNRRAIIVNFQLTKGMQPDVAKGDYSPQVLARLLLTRGQLLTKQENEENRLLARMFFQLAAELDPKNEDVVYVSEVDRLDRGSVDWTYLTRPRPLPDATPVPDKDKDHRTVPVPETVTPPVERERPRPGPPGRP